MVDDAVAEEVAGNHDAGGEHVGELQSGGAVGGVAHYVGATGERFLQARGHKAVLVDGHHLGQVFPVNVRPQDRPAIGSRRQLDLGPAAGPRSPAARALATAWAWLWAPSLA